MVMTIMRAMFVAATLMTLAAPSWAQDKPAKRQTNVITKDEIQAIQSEAADAYQVVERLRPQFLRVRGGAPRTEAGAEPVEIKVVVDNAGRGGLEQLRQIPSNTIKEIRFLNGTDASIQYGTNYGAGAILVTTR
jgi:hypothetical protein